MGKGGQAGQPTLGDALQLVKERLLQRVKLLDVCRSRRPPRLHGERLAQISEVEIGLELVLDCGKLRGKREACSDQREQTARRASPDGGGARALAVERYDDDSAQSVEERVEGRLRKHQGGGHKGADDTDGILELRKCGKERGGGARGQHGVEIGVYDAHELVEARKRLEERTRQRLGGASAERSTTCGGHHHPLVGCGGCRGRMSS